MIFADLTDILSLHVLLKKMVIITHSFSSILNVLAQKVVQDEIESLKEIRIIAKVINCLYVCHSIMNKITIYVPILAVFV